MTLGVLRPQDPKRQFLQAASSEQVLASHLPSLGKRPENGLSATIH